MDQMKQLRAGLERAVPTVMEPEDAAERILAAVESDRLYALTHGDMDGRIRQRAESILAALSDQSRPDDRHAPSRFSLLIVCVVNCSWSTAPDQAR